MSILNSIIAVSRQLTNFITTLRIKFYTKAKLLKAERIVFMVITFCTYNWHTIICDIMKNVYYLD